MSLRHLRNIWVQWVGNACFSNGPGILQTLCAQDPTTSIRILGHRKALEAALASRLNSSIPMFYVRCEGLHFPSLHHNRLCVVL